MGKPALYNTDTLLQAGIDPRTRLPKKVAEVLQCVDKKDIKRQLRIVDEQDAINRFTWYNLPASLNSRLIERILYYKGQGMFFQLKDKFYFLPYALNGTIDVYGRYEGVSPLPFNGTANDGEPDKPWITGLTFKPQYDILLSENFSDKDIEEIKYMMERSCVLLKDYTEQYSQTNISRQVVNDSLLDVMSDCIPFMRTALLAGTGVEAMRVGSEPESANVYAANHAINNAALTGERFVPVVGNLDFQSLANGPVYKAEEYLLSMQALDNYRLSLYGLDNGGLFQKRSHMLEAEQETNQGNVGLIMRDSLQNRQDFCNIVNSIWGLDVWCEPSEVVLNVDTNGDGTAGSDETNENFQSVADEEEENV